MYSAKGISVRQVCFLSRGEKPKERIKEAKELKAEESKKGPVAFGLRKKREKKRGRKKEGRKKEKRKKEKKKKKQRECKTIIF